MVIFLSIGNSELRPVLFINIQERETRKTIVGNEEVAGPSCAIKWWMLLSTDKCSLMHV